MNTAKPRVKQVGADRSNVTYSEPLPGRVAENASF